MQKVKNVFSGVISGIIFIIIGTALLWFGEKNNVANIKTVKEIEDKVISVASDSVDSNNEGKLICTNGDLVVNDDMVSDSTFNVGIKTSRLVRVVEMYQWEEDEETDSDNNTTYTYKKVWSDDLIDSSEFRRSGHDNPTMMPYEGEEFLASSVNVGKFSLSDKQKSNLGLSSTLQIPDTAVIPTNYKKLNSYITNSLEEANPQIGDVRISFKYNNWNAVTILAVQTGDSFSDFISKAGKNVNRVENGKLTSAEIINQMKKENKIIKWIIRVVGILLNIFGFVGIVSLITNILNKIPFFGNIVSSAINFILSIVGFIYSLIIIIIAWFRYRPLLCLILLLVIAALIALIFYIKKKSQDNGNNGDVQQINNNQLSGQSNMQYQNQQVNQPNNYDNQPNMQYQNQQINQSNNYDNQSNMQYQSQQINQQNNIDNSQSNNNIQ